MGVNRISPRLSVEGLKILLGGPGPVPAGGAERIVVHVPVIRRLYSLGKRGYVKFQRFLYKGHEKSSFVVHNRFFFNDNIRNRIKYTRKSLQPLQ